MTLNNINFEFLFQFLNLTHKIKKNDSVMNPFYKEKIFFIYFELNGSFFGISDENIYLKTINQIHSNIMRKNQNFSHRNMHFKI